MKKAPSIGLAGAALCSLFAVSGMGASASGQPQTPKTQITWMVWGSTSGVVNNEKALFAAYPQLKDKYTFVPIVGGAGDPQVATKLRLELTAHSTVPDIVMLNYTELPEFASVPGVLTDLTPYFKPYLSDLPSATKELAQYKGQYMDVPYEIKTRLWFYRKDMFAKAGINPSQVHNLTALIAAGKRLQKFFPHSYIWNLGSSIAGYDLGLILSGNGGEFTNSKGQFVINTNPGVRAAFEAFKQLQDSGVVADISDFTPAWESGLANGTIASSLISSWFQLFLPQYAPKLSGDWGIAQWPTIAGASVGSEAGGSIEVVPANAPDKQAAIDVLTKLFLTKQGNLGLFKTDGVMPLTKSALNAPITQKPVPYFGSAFPVQERVALNRFHVFPYDPAASQELAIVEAYMQEYVDGKISLDSALNQAQKACEAQIGNPYSGGL